MTDDPEARIAKITQERDSWRRVAERLEGEKQAAEARVIALRQAFEQIASCESFHPGDVVAIARAALLADVPQERT